MRSLTSRLEQDPAQEPRRLQQRPETREDHRAGAIFAPGRSCGSSGTQTPPMTRSRSAAHTNSLQPPRRNQDDPGLLLFCVPDRPGCAPSEGGAPADPGGIGTGNEGAPAVSAASRTGAGAPLIVPGHGKQPREKPGRMATVLFGLRSERHQARTQRSKGTKRIRMARARSLAVRPEILPAPRRKALEPGLAAAQQVG